MTITRNFTTEEKFALANQFASTYHGSNSSTRDVMIGRFACLSMASDCFSRGSDVIINDTLDELVVDGKSVRVKGVRSNGSYLLINEEEQKRGYDAFCLYAVDDNCQSSTFRGTVKGSDVTARAKKSQYCRMPANLSAIVADNKLTAINCRYLDKSSGLSA